MPAARPAQSRGRERRARLTAAAAAVLDEAGLDALTHRRAAEAAGVPLGSVTYYFETLDELLGSASALLLDRELERSRQLLERCVVRARGDRSTAELLVNVLLEDRGHAVTLSLYERLLGGARHPGIQAALAARQAVFAARMDEALRRCGREGPLGGSIFINVIDGAILGALAEGAAPVRPVALRAVEVVLHAMRTNDSL